jgi:hypothetical protein
VIINNSGNSDYTFTENGSFTFEYHNGWGVTGESTANVDWIGDGIPIEATFAYTPK